MERRVGRRQQSPEPFRPHPHAKRFAQTGSPLVNGAAPASQLERWLQRLEDLSEEHRSAIADVCYEIRREVRADTLGHILPLASNLRSAFDLCVEREREDTNTFIFEYEARPMDEVPSAEESPLSSKSPRPVPMIGDDGCPSLAEEVATRNTTDGDDSDRWESPVQPSVAAPVLGKSCTSFLSGATAVPERAFVVNLRRLMSTLELLRLLHEFVKSTAIAALTLVAAGTQIQVRNTGVFLVGVFLLYHQHETLYDLFDIEDLKILASHYPGEPTQENPNQILKAMETRTNRQGQTLRMMIHLAVMFMLVFTWYNSTAWYVTECPDDDCENVDIERYVIHNGDDLEFASMQVTVLTVMYIFAFLFDIIHFYEMGWWMPKRHDGEVWDVRVHGTPRRFQLFGFPSMWFSASEVRRDLRIWVDALGANRTVVEIFPEELGLLAIDGDDGMRDLLVATLRDAKFYDASTGDCDRHRRLDIELCFFTLDYHSTEMGYPGTFMSPTSPSSSQALLMSPSRMSRKSDKRGQL